MRYLASYIRIRHLGRYALNVKAEGVVPGGCVRKGEATVVLSLEISFRETGTSVAGRVRSRRRRSSSGTRTRTRTGGCGSAKRNKAA